MPLPLWIRTPDDLQALARDLTGVGAVAIDTEADSLHHYPGKLCLVQIADARGRGHLVDPLALRDLSRLGPVLADPGTLKVLHAADNDLAYLKRLYGVTVVSLFDTAVAARFIGATSLGLEGLLSQYLGVTAVKSRQKDDWSRRPLTPEQEAYALDDVLHLIPLRERLLEALHAIGRAQWVEEECAGLAALVVPEKPADPDAYMKLKGARELDARGLAALRELHAARETLAIRLDRPPFMIVGNESLVVLAARRPHDAEGILAVPGCTPPVIRRAGPAIVEAIARAEALPEAELPVYRPAPRPHVPAAVRRRAEALREWRGKASKEVGLEPGVLFPQRLIDRLAAAPPADLAALRQVEGVRDWRVGLFGADLLRVLAVA
ncbi:MAG TPA: HRDC domain-containing protein [Candidatus Deferrimicrobiaceae bacterium]|nr:HRDC domain-containing protein [Candidatus Deferrimicrobiaceae bacterium]